MDGKIEVAVEYGGVNFADIYTRQGLREIKCPFVMGIECAGKITAIGERVFNPDFKVSNSRHSARRIIFFFFRLDKILYAMTLKLVYTEKRFVLIQSNVLFYQTILILKMDVWCSLTI